MARRPSSSTGCATTGATTSTRCWTRCGARPWRPSVAAKKHLRVTELRQLLECLFGRPRQHQPLRGDVTELVHRDSDAVLADAKEAADVDHGNGDFAVRCNQHVLDLADALVLVVIDACAQKLRGAPALE